MRPSLTPGKLLGPGLAAVALAFAALIIAGGAAQAHVAPAVGDNNRYLKLTLLGDRIRLLYTVFYGETPGAELRQSLDRNRDGTLDDTETSAFGTQLGSDIAGSVVITLDGTPAPVAWSQVVVGLGTSQVRAGAFSVDLIAWLCLPSPRGTHAVLFRDHYPLARPGETEVSVEDSPGVEILASRIGGAIDEAHDYKLVGPSGALDTEGLDLRFAAGDKAVVTPDTICRRAEPERGPPVTAIAGAAAAVLAGAVALAITLVVRRRKPARHGRAP
jgi:hypothetical protein